ncbi:hypothetical protein NBRC116188_00180 [Oceaniserpentilla sp. 4NH20-0058]|uniref:hypothetical protein n=1 Tax=Oceaniserpentilla sp. 4NH20-0058 TaxID=3127660 RepID=UPI00310AC4FF
MSNAQSLIEQFYQEEQERLAQESTFTPIDVSVSSADMAMINTISKRFNKDKSQLVREALSQAIIDMFSALEPVERKMLAKDADELANSIAAEIAEEQGLPSLEENGINWVAQDKQCLKDERKAEKEQQKQQDELAQKILAELEAQNKPEQEATQEQTTANETVESQEEALEEQPQTDDAPFASDNAGSDTEEETPSNNSIFA